jgi:hypothetical protein
MRNIILALLGAAAVMQVSTAHADVTTRTEARWRFTADVDADAFLQSGVAVTLGVTPAALPSWRFGLSTRSHDLPEFQMGLGSNNDNMYVTTPIAVEAVAQYRHRVGLVAGARAGVVHLHYTRIGTFGIDEEFNYGITPFVGYEWRPIDRVYIQPWLGAMATVYRQTHGELPMDEADRTYSKWPAAIRGGILIGARY